MPDPVCLLTPYAKLTLRISGVDQACDVCGSATRPNYRYHGRELHGRQRACCPGLRHTTDERGGAAFIDTERLLGEDWNR